jgi:hypothetical protein
MKDATTAQSAKLVTSFDLCHNLKKYFFLYFQEFKWSKYLQWLLYITN